ncbi:hypothetical protein [Paenibacillus sp. Marseille-Q4541]|nr:hypothetical protein [Paenibacillus sp. Marseille-Q4541]
MPPSPEENILSMLGIPALGRLAANEKMYNSYRKAATFYLS